MLFRSSLLPSETSLAKPRACPTPARVSSPARQHQILSPDRPRPRARVQKQAARPPPARACAARALHMTPPSALARTRGRLLSCDAVRRWPMEGRRSSLLHRRFSTSGARLLSVRPILLSWAACDTIDTSWQSHPHLLPPSSLSLSARRAQTETIVGVEDAWSMRLATWQNFARAVSRSSFPMENGIASCVDTCMEDPADASCCEWCSTVPPAT